MNVAGDGIAAPNDDQFGFGKEFRLHAELAAQGVNQALAASRCANGAVQQGSAYLVKKARCHRFTLHPAHGAAVAVGQDRFRVVGCNGFELGSYVLNGFFPAYFHKLPRPLGA